MRREVAAAAAIVLGLALPGCAAGYDFSLRPVDPVEAGERAVIGAAIGAGLGSGLGAIVAINPGVGSVLGAEAGAAIGAAVGVITATPVPEYAPIAPPATATIRGFYDGWPPGYHPSPAGSEASPPPPG